MKSPNVTPLDMEPNIDEDAIDDWSMRAWGEAPVEIFHWSSIDQRHEVLLKYSNMVAVARLEGAGIGDFSTEEQVLIRINEWSPGSIQANRLADGSIKVRFRRQNITLSAMLKAPDALSSMLEEWLMGMRAEPEHGRGRFKRVKAVKRQRDAVARMLDQASVEKLVESYEQIESKLSDSENSLAGSVADE